MREPRNQQHSSPLPWPENVVKATGLDFDGRRGDFSRVPAVPATDFCGGPAATTAGFSLPVKRKTLTSDHKEQVAKATSFAAKNWDIGRIEVHAAW